MNQRKWFCRGFIVFSYFSFCVASTAVAAGKTIDIGMSVALTGPAASLGQGMKLGVETYLKQINSSGGVNGKQINLIALDDGYDPVKAGSNVRKLIADNEIVAAIGNVGTPTAIVTVPIFNQKKTLLFGAFTGAGLLRKNPADRYIINYRASYAQETQAMIQGLLQNGIKPEEIAFFTQNDGYGDAGYKGAVKALKGAGFNETEKLAHGRYTRGTTNIEDGLSAILDAKVEPKAIIMVGAYKACSAFIKLAKEDLPNVIFLNVSFVGSNALAKALGDDGEGVVVTQVVPHFNSDEAGVKEYRDALKKNSPDSQPGFVSLEGYIAAKLLVEGFKKSKTVATEDLIDGIHTISNYDAGIGVPITFSKGLHQASNKIWPTIIKGGKFVPLEWKSLKK